jgi:hypothetical protein
MSSLRRVAAVAHVDDSSTRRRPARGTSGSHAHHTPAVSSQQHREASCALKVQHLADAKGSATEAESIHRNNGPRFLYR